MAIREVARGWLLLILLAILIARLWVMPIASSFWVDETATAFVVHHGANDPSLKVAPQVAESIYYVLPRASERLFGFSEWAYRLPSLVAMGLALWLIARIAARLFHSEAAWFAVFCCLSMRAFNDQAADARPYGLGTLVVCAAMWFLLRWVASGDWRDWLGFAVAGVLVCQVHLIFWPMYLVFGLIALRRPLALIVIAMGVAAVVLPALRLLHEAGAHVVALQPVAWDLGVALRLGSVTAVALAAVAVAKWRGWHVAHPATASLLVVGAWWLIDPLSLFAFSHVAGASVFVPRYMSVALPGVALAITSVVALFVPPEKWRPITLALAGCVLIFTGGWSRLWPTHHSSDWRAAAAAVPAGLPVLCPSPFVEARPPVWRPDYPTDSFLYSNLQVYPVAGKHYPLPYKRSPEAERAVGQWWTESLAVAPGFALFGIDGEVEEWRRWFRARPETAAWRDTKLGGFGDVTVIVFEGPTWPSANRGSSASPPDGKAR